MKHAIELLEHELTFTEMADEVRKDVKKAVESLKILSGINGPQIPKAFNTEGANGIISAISMMKLAGADKFEIVDRGDHYELLGRPNGKP
jgi:hypothetical protein